jgi:hypothetical protein
MRFLGLLLLLVAGPIGAQQATPQPPAEPAQKEKERRPLNLRLENPSSFATVAPAEKPPAKDLPALGGDSRKPAAPQEGIGIGRTDSPVYPKDTNPTR